MTVKDLETLFDYGHWANAKLFAVISQMKPELFTQPVAGSYGSLRNTMVHLLSAEWGWMDRCGGPPRGPALKAEDYPTLASVIERWKQVEADIREFLAKLKDDDLNRVIEFSLGGGPKQALPAGALLQHAAIHGVHHRGQVALLLRLIGHAPGNVDFLFYCDRS